MMSEDLVEAEILKLAPEGGALIVPLFTSRGGAVFIVPGGTRKRARDHILMLPGCTHQLLETWLR